MTHTQIIVTNQKDLKEVDLRNIMKKEVTTPQSRKVVAEAEVGDKEATIMPSKTKARTTIMKAMDSIKTTFRKTN
jgi:hypothetical protein